MDNILPDTKRAKVCSVTTSDKFTEEREDNFKDAPDIKNVKFSKAEIYSFKTIHKYYKDLDNNKVQIMVDIVNGDSYISLRLLDWFITKRRSMSSSHWSIHSLKGFHTVSFITDMAQMN